jgi:hypothetical protein
MHEARMLDRKGSIETLVVSIAGTPPSEKDWEQLFTRMAGTHILSIHKALYRHDSPHLQRDALKLCQLEVLLQFT